MKKMRCRKKTIGDILKRMKSEINRRTGANRERDALMKSKQKRHLHLDIRNILEGMLLQHRL